MKKLLSKLLVVLTAVPLFIPVGTASASDFECGNWYDVPDNYMEVIETVCEYGIMQGMSENYFGYNHQLTRAEMAVIGNRIVFGSSTYDNIDELPGFSTAMFNYLLSRYNDAPDDLPQNTWILKAMFFSSDISQQYYEWPNGIMTGDGNQNYTSFRPLENVNIVEAYKVLYEAAYQAEVLDEVYKVVYSGSPWYGDLLEHLDGEHAISSLDLDGQSIYLGGAVGKSYGPFSESVYREHVAQFLYMMIEGGLIDKVALEEHVYEASVENEPEFIISDVYLNADEDKLTIEVRNEGTISVHGASADVRVLQYNGDGEEIYESDLDYDFDEVGTGEEVAKTISLRSSTESVEIRVTSGYSSHEEVEETYYLSDL